MTFAKMRNENTIQYFLQGTHMSINTDNGNIHTHTNNVTQERRERKENTLSVIDK